MVDGAEIPARDLLLDELHVLSAAPVEDNAKNALRTARCVDNLLAFRGRWRQWLLDHDMFAGLQCRERHRHVQDIRHGDGHCLDVRVRDQILVVSIDARNIELLGQVPAALLIQTRDGKDLSARVLGEALQVQETDSATNNSDLKSPGTVTFTPLNIGSAREHGIRRSWRQAALGTALDQCHERDLRRTTEAHRRAIDANPAGRIDRHSRGHVESLHESPAAHRRSNCASNGQPHLTAVTVPG